MNRMKIFLPVVFLLSGVAAGQDSMTVEQAVQRVLQIHPVLGQALANIRAAEARTLQASSSQFPEISTDAVYAHIGPVPEFSFPAFGSIVLAPADNYDAHVSGKYTVFDFGKTSAAVDLSQSKE